MTTYTDIMKMCKQEGFSVETVTKCKRVLSLKLLDGSERMRRLHRLITSYLDAESTLLTAEHSNHNVSSDIIESDFGIFKDSMPSNKNNGFTESILYIPLRPKACNLKDTAKIDIKTIMERRTVNEVKQWKNEHLKNNPMSKRRNLLVA